MTPLRSPAKIRAPAAIAGESVADAVANRHSGMPVRLADAGQPSTGDAAVAVDGERLDPVADLL